MSRLECFVDYAYCCPRRIGLRAESMLRGDGLAPNVSGALAAELSAVARWVREHESVLSSAYGTKEGRSHANSMLSIIVDALNTGGPGTAFAIALQSRLDDTKRGTTNDVG